MTRSGSVQAQAAVVGGLLATAGFAWWSTAVRMKGAAATAARRHIPSGTVLLVGGYLLVGTLAGLAVYGVLAVASHAAGLAWASGGRWLSVGVLILAAAYELTPIKRAFLTRCRCPLARASSRGRHGAIAGGMSAGVWCLGCSWALMAALFALGVMSLIWMALVASTLQRTN
jgi:predicted metal-binding membrane protein